MNKDKVIELAKHHNYYEDDFAENELLAFAAAIRDAALENAARICSGIAYSDLLKSEVGECAVAAMRIRALKGK